MKCKKFGNAIICGDDSNKKKCHCGYIFKKDFCEELNAIDYQKGEWCVPIICPNCGKKIGIVLCMIQGQISCDIKTGRQI
jgi:hypothetical protein